MGIVMTQRGQFPRATGRPQKPFDISSKTNGNYLFGLENLVFYFCGY